MSDQDIELLMELAKSKLDQARLMTKTQAIRSLNDAGILTTKGDFKKDYQPLEEILSK